MVRNRKKGLAQIAMVGFLLLMASIVVRAETVDFQTTPRIEPYAIASEGEYVYIAGDAVNLAGLLPDGSLDLGAGMKDIWLVKLDSEGIPVFTALIGGTNDDVAYGLTVEQGVVYLLGETWSTDFPAAPGNAGENDALLLAVAADGSGILWARRFGGSDQDSGRALALHEDAIYVTGITWSRDMVPDGAKGDADGFLARVGLDGSIDWLNIFGGRGLDAPFDLSISGESLWVAGQTYSNDFAGRTLGDGDVFAAQFDLDGTQQFAGLYGGNQEDIAYAISTAPSGDIYLAGATKSINLEADGGTYSGNWDGLFMQLDADGNFISTSYLGGTGIEYAQDLLVLPNGDALVAGWTLSPSFPLGYEVPESSSGGEDAFIIQFTASGELASSWLRGSDLDESAVAMTLNASGLWLAGENPSGDVDYFIQMPPSELVDIPLPTPQPPPPTATTAPTATPRPTETPLPTSTQTNTPLPSTTLTATAAAERTATAEAEATLGISPSPTGAAGGESTSTVENTPTLTQPAEEMTTEAETSAEMETASQEQEVDSALTSTALATTATAQEGEIPITEESEEDSNFITYLLVGGGLSLAVALGGAYYYTQHKKRND